MTSTLRLSLLAPQERELRAFPRGDLSDSVLDLVQRLFGRSFLVAAFVPVVLFWMLM